MRWLHISDEGVALARDLAALENITLTDAVNLALKEALETRRTRESGAVRLQRMRAISHRFADIDRGDARARSLWEVMDDLYDENGLPK